MLISCPVAFKHPANWTVSLINHRRNSAGPTTSPKTPDRSTPDQTLFLPHRGGKIGIVMGHKRTGAKGRNGLPWSRARDNDQVMRDVSATRGNNGIHRGSQRNSNNSNNNSRDSPHHSQGPPVRFGNKNSNNPNNSPRNQRTHRGRGGGQGQRYHPSNHHNLSHNIAGDVTNHHQQHHHHLAENTSDSGFESDDLSPTEQSYPYFHNNNNTTTMDPLSLPSSAPLNRNCKDCRQIRKTNLKSRDDIFRTLQSIWSGLVQWSNDVGVPFGIAEDEMDWQPEPITLVLVVDRERDRLREYGLDLGKSEAGSEWGSPSQQQTQTQFQSWADGSFDGQDGQGQAGSNSSAWIRAGGGCGVLTSYTSGCNPTTYTGSSVPVLSYTLAGRAKAEVELEADAGRREIPMEPRMMENQAGGKLPHG
ncbi:uncharacterized protein BCR38DRAFT_470656 [Pseudomassariella vexata]|uniref:Uncharacterized protein n=1 Tax=Pseudomassariella vexata TaxID=1141098 RepID=A0A1Y2EJR1_9PEZI|nr:uncharacterized protein BCR38DRAFT_470656 [Pseudomassariella vexata]ORY71780.1 hypothetical protein BCR38DRAFT_470656 [Pseudomassariella vexata]